MDAAAFQNQIWEMLRKLTDELEISYRTISEKYSLTTIQTQALLKLDAEGGSSVGGLAKAMRMDVGNLSALCKRLERRGLLTRSRDPMDERVVRVSLSGEGKQMVGRMQEETRHRYGPIIDRVSQEDMGHMMGKLDEILIHLRKINEQALPLGPESES